MPLTTIYKCHGTLEDHSITPYKIPLNFKELSRTQITTVAATAAALLKNEALMKQVLLVVVLIAKQGFVIQPRVNGIIAKIAKKTFGILV